MANVAGGQLDHLKLQARSLFQANRLEDASKLYLQVLSLNKRDPEALQVLGTICQRFGKLAEAERYFKAALKIDKKNHELFYQLATVYLAQHQAVEGSKLLRQALKIKPDFFEPWMELGNVNAWSGRISEAIAAYQKAIRINPGQPIPHCNLGNVLAEQGKPKEAFLQWQKALELDPDYLSAHSNMLLCMNYEDGRDQQEVFDAHKDWASRQRQGIERYSSHTNAKDPDKRLRIGYLSADFKEHSVAYFISPIMQHHNRDAFEVYVYSSVERPDKRTAWFKKVADHFVDVSLLGDPEVAARIVNDQIDILVDLSGHTSGNRLSVFARKPAPIQVAYLGYPNTTGLTEIDYRITDSWADEKDRAEAFYTEKLIYLDNGFLCFQPPAEAPDVQPPPCVDKGYVTFGSFNYSAKISERVLGIWATILKQLPSSKMLLKYRSFADQKTQRYFLDRFAHHGIEPNRIQFMGQTPSKAAHLASYHKVDIALDTIPYNGTTTTFDTLWMGVPVVTLKGKRHASRVGYSILKRLGLADLVAQSEEDYVVLSVALANNRQKLVELRSTLRDRLKQSGISDGKQFTQEIESCYRNMWKSWCSIEAQD